MLNDILFLSEMEGKFNIVERSFFIMEEVVLVIGGVVKLIVKIILLC